MGRRNPQPGGPGQGSGSPGPPRAGQADEGSVLRLGAREELRTAGVAGLGAFLAGYALLYVVKSGQIMSNFFAGMQATGGSATQLQSAGIALPAKWKVVGMVYHSVHNVAYSFTVTAAGQQQTFSFGRGFMSGDLLPWLIPMGVLFAAGFLVARRLGAAGTGRGAVVGAKTAVGYIVLVAITKFVFVWSATTTQAGATQSISLGPALVPALAFAGVLYPLVFGGLGGAAAVALGSRKGQSARPPTR